MNIEPTTLCVTDLLDQQRIYDLEMYQAKSYLEPQRFIAWTEAKKLLVIIDMTLGEITRCRIASVETREAAEAAIAALSPKH
ncbi:MAG: hypothetical protein IPL00_03350 [Gammaproteobacteria bacterium]|nr:hypothetical protein [Gammaproteobacteria bacterium]